jgi:nucleoside-diphosphate-sugar epimerase
LGNVIVVAGGGGFIGGHLVAELLGRGHAVRAVDIKPFDEWFQLFPGAENVQLDLTEKGTCEAACRGARVVYNLACDMGGVGFMAANKARCMLSVLTNTHLLLAARDVGVERYFFPSSACVYHVSEERGARGKPMVEGDAYPALPEDGYGWEKIFSERMCRHFREDFGVGTRVARFYPIHGPFSAWEGGRERAPAAMCRKVIEAVRTGSNQIEIWGDGEQVRTFLYIDDAIRGLRMLTDSDLAEPANIGSTDLVTINQLAQIVEEIAGVRLRITHKLDAPRGAAGLNGDSSLMRAETGWEPTVPLREGLERTYRWIYDEYAAKYGGGAGPVVSVPKGAVRGRRAAAARG